MNVHEPVIVAITFALVFWLVRAMHRLTEEQRRELVRHKSPEARKPADCDSLSTADSFRFCPELFEYRSEVLDKLSSEGFEWQSDFSSVDCLHDVYGLEVCGIVRREDAVRITDILVSMFPDWKPG